jgi:hypothetical protein
LLNHSQILTKVNNLYNTPSSTNNDGYFYGSQRQHNFTSLSSTLPSFSTLVDKKRV